ncbi:hypothetical protein BD626DRAFT_512760 [Schizophyllum amplum]|uniref:Uncharacterized protein n=1 Tax=Schizophyllum amplum TaxID=97359 RepID=A0A550BZX8_9AGAR|nr:hypothetical protein BD626DRAFT_512760 [Auriculariopsis ampla]
MFDPTQTHTYSRKGSAPGHAVQRRNLHAPTPRGPYVPHAQSTYLSPPPNNSLYVPPFRRATPPHFVRQEEYAIDSRSSVLHPADERGLSGRHSSFINAVPEFPPHPSHRRRLSATAPAFQPSGLRFSQQIQSPDASAVSLAEAEWSDAGTACENDAVIADDTPTASPTPAKSSLGIDVLDDISTAGAEVQRGRASPDSDMHCEDDADQSVLTVTAGKDQTSQSIPLELGQVVESSNSEVALESDTRMDVYARNIPHAAYTLARAERERKRYMEERELLPLPFVPSIATSVCPRDTESTVVQDDAWPAPQAPPLPADWVYWRLPSEA